MASGSIDDGEFWLPPQFLTDDDIFMENKNSSFTTTGSNSFKGASKDVFGGFEPLLSPFEFSYGLSSSDLSSPVESVLGSTETESDEEDYLAGLTRQMAHSTLEDEFVRNELCFGNDNIKGWGLAGSPQSTLCGVGNGCGCKQGSSRGSPNRHSQVSSPPATWDLLYEAAGEVARMRMNEELCGRLNIQNKGLVVPSRMPSSVSVPLKSSTATTRDVSLYQQHHHHHHQQSLSTYQKLQASQFQLLRHQQMMKQQQQQQQQSSGVWGGQVKGNGLLQQQQQQLKQPVVQNSRVRSNGRSLDLSASAWPPLHQAQQQQPQQQNGSAMRAVFLGNSAAKRESVGTGVFLPRRIGTPADTRKKPACSTVLLPARVVQALNLNLDEMGGPQPPLQPQQYRFNGVHNLDDDTVSMLRNSNFGPNQKQRGLKHQPGGMSNEVRLPQEWTY